MVYFAGQTHIPGLARVPALPRVPGLTRGTFPDAPSPFTPYLRDSEPYRRNKHHVGNNVTANSVSGACTNPNNTDPTASPASSAHLGPNSGSSAHQDCYKHSPQHGGELIRLASFREILSEIEESNLNQFSGKSIRFDSVVRSRRIVVPCFVFDSDSGYRRVTTILRSRAASYPRGSWSGCETTRKPHPPPSPGSRGGEARMARDLEGEGGRDPPFREVIVSYLVPALHPLIQRNNDIQPAVSISSPADLQHDPPVVVSPARGRNCPLRPSLRPKDDLPEGRG